MSFACPFLFHMKALLIAIICIILSTNAVCAEIPTPTAIPTGTQTIFGATEIDAGVFELPSMTLDCELPCMIYQNTMIAANYNNALDIMVYVIFAIAAISWLAFEFGEDADE